MDHHFFSISFMLCLCYFLKFSICVHDPAYLTGDVSINCGSVGTSEGKQWVGDAHPTITSSVQVKGKSTISRVARDSVSADPIPYDAARISRSGFAYLFLVSPGEKFIRLHFNPTPYKGFQKYKDMFTVEAGSFTLLSNFSASLTADALGLTSIIKEFCISVEENHPLHIVFTPTSSLSGDTYAFLNGIEIITVPLGRSYFHDDGDIGAQVVGRMSQWFYIDNSTVLEMVRRVNIKRDGYASSGDDISDMFGILETASKEKANLIDKITWKITVDVGFRYLARLHFPDVGLKMVHETGSTNFKVLINEMIAYSNIDFVRERDTSNIIVYKDYMVMSKGPKGVKHHILVSLQSYGVSIDGYVPFTGFEILKLSNFHNSLACPNPSPPALDSPSRTVQILLSVLGHRNSIVTVSISIIALVNIIVHKFGDFWEARCVEEDIKPSDKAQRFSRRFSLAEIKLATKNFSYHHILGKGGFGNVYKGLIGNGNEVVAVKRLKFDSRQGAHEFLAEIETLSELRHYNLVSLIGYCSEQREMILVYDYMAGGTLADHLYKLARKGCSCAFLTWKQRLNICIGAGRGLDYLHTGNGVIHRDVKTSNILLDENFTPKVSDFGLVKHENLSNLQSHVSTKVKGTFGYLDPTYFRTGKLTRKSDTYAFGVVLLEVLCGRPALDRRVSEAEQILSKWAQEKIREGEVELIVDSNLIKEISPNSLKAFVEIAERCLNEEPNKRPTMTQVVLQLESALEQQDILESSIPKEIMIDVPCSNETNLSVGEQATTVPSIDERTPSSPPKEQTNNQIDHDYSSYRIKEGRKAWSDKPSRKSLWDALLKKLKPSRKIQDPILSEMCKLDINLPNLKPFSFNELRNATRNFRPDSLLGEGGFGYVFKGWIDENTLTATKPGSGLAIAVKKLKPEGFQGHKEWLTEVNYLGQLRHPNLVKLIGYCSEDDNRLLVYEFMSKGSLENHLFRRGHHSISWDTRVKVAMDAARGLSFLHEAREQVIYRDFKASNILLDGEFNAKLSDFGLAKAGPTGDRTHVSTRVMGTYGYAAPEYIATGRLSSKSDVYGFGVVLLELLSGRPVVDKTKVGIEQNLVEWARPCLSDKRKLFRIMDTKLEGQYPQKAAYSAATISLQCLNPDPKLRPRMAEVLATLEQLQTPRNTRRFPDSEHRAPFNSVAATSPFKHHPSMKTTALTSPLPAY